MSTNDQPEAPCLGPGCPNSVKQTGIGRKRVYCSESCGVRYRRRARPAADNNAFAKTSLADLQRLLDQLDLSGNNPEQTLKLIVDCEVVWKDLKSAAVLQSRDSRVRMPAIADTLHMSPSALARMMESAPGRRDRRLSPPLIPAQPSAPRSPRHPVPGPPRARRPEGGTGDTDGAAPSHGPAATLASALSHLHRHSGMTHKALGDQVGVDPSYISRTMSGERIPSWEVTHKLAQALESDPEEILTLWRAARGYDTTGTTNLQAALRGLHTAAGRPKIEALQAKTHLPQKEITDAFSGPAIPDWQTTAILVKALHGHSDFIRPLWNAANAANLATISNSPTCTIHVGAFG
ncbi:MULTISPECIES: helix-turn-helix domain-containing protein [Streptomyces]|uniref:helix-turn-helix domain-containing protein n=1 Tax=Streptomyces TaxID=1883 RepID=UPI0033250F62